MEATIPQWAMQIKGRRGVLREMSVENSEMPLVGAIMMAKKRLQRVGILLVVVAEEEEEEGEGEGEGVVEGEEGVVNGEGKRRYAAITVNHDYMAHHILSNVSASFSFPLSFLFFPPFSFFLPIPVAMLLRSWGGGVSGRL